MSPPKNALRPEPHWLNKSAMAASLGISVQAFDKWGVEPIAKVGRSVYYTVANVVHNRVSHEIEKYQPRIHESQPDEVDGKSMDHERLRLTSAQADGQELKNAKDRREVIETDFNIFCLSKISSEVASILDTVPLSFKRRFPELEAKHIEHLRRDLVKAQNIAADLDSRIPDYLDEYLASSD
ncbi:DNA-packaging protein [Aliivibrio fischeri]|uniref:terminase small subunit n=1 Tax=Aliivibrio fischeri TaxID=668 RepID=UPI00080E9D24|nr:terminase small subunit [Aliivibrio fischeri]OCH31826.1 DNA-packaging protein [Aliivibrio fischeri]